MNVAFYAPLKAPDHPVPSGDRAMARMLMRALKAAGHQVTLASRLRSFEGAGDARAQARIRDRARAVRQRLLAKLREIPEARRPHAWFTYHLYHKAPDLLGPAVSEALAVPYLIAEASHAPKQQGGPWDAGFHAAAEAMRGASRILCLNPVDRPCVSALVGDPGRLVDVAPFIDARGLAMRAVRGATDGESRRQALGMSSQVPVLVTVAMMRDGAKLASYRILAKALEGLVARPWQLLIIGDGQARDRVHEAFSTLANRVFFAGAVPARELPVWLAGCDLHLWPSVDEAWGMAILEAAAAGVPSVAGDEGGVSTVLENGHTGLLARARDPADFARAVAVLLEDAGLRRRFAVASRDKAISGHGLEAAAMVVDAVLREAVVRAHPG